MRVRREVIHSVIEKVLVLPITEVRARLAKDVVDFFNNYPNVDRICRKPPVILLQLPSLPLGFRSPPIPSWIL